MLRQDGKAWEGDHHIYPSPQQNIDEDLSSEAEVAAFLIYTKSKDIPLAEQVIRAWIALIIENKVKFDDTKEDMKEVIETTIQSLPYHLVYSLSINEYWNICDKSNYFESVDTVYEFVDKVRDNISKIRDDIAFSFNQQFCRVRYGGQYRPEKGNMTLWYRISSVGYNWANTIYVFTAETILPRHKVDSIFIVRDHESDYGEDEGQPEYIYKAKDGTPYFNMPIEEYLKEEHEHSPVFAASKLVKGRNIMSHIYRELINGNTLYHTRNDLRKNNFRYNRSNSYVISHLTRREKNQKCIEGSQFFEDAHTRTKIKLNKIERMIISEHPEITHIEFDKKPYENSKGKETGFELLFLLESKQKELDGLEIGIVFTRDMSQVTPNSIVRSFNLEYNYYLESIGLK